MPTQEVNFDGVVGPTHNYAGLSRGNLASTDNAGLTSRPKEAALQGLAKMRQLHQLGIPQGILPPHERPDLCFLRSLGFRGNDTQLLNAAAKTAPSLLATAYSASAMWAANAATVSPSADTADQCIHFTPANLCQHLHRSLETAMTARLLKRIFPNGRVFAHHDPLPSHPRFGDEGAANHSRFSHTHGAPGVELFIYGRDRLRDDLTFPARQSREASFAVARLHRLREERTIFAQQHPDAIAQGVFHNDVISVGHLQTLFLHEIAFLDQPRVLDQLRAALSEAGGELHVIEVTTEEVSLADAVRSYLFNSQLMQTPDGKMMLLAPEECRETASVWHHLEKLQESGVFHEVMTLNLRQSMRNGGGPACLRLRVVLTDEERCEVHPQCLFSEELYDDLTIWIKRHYREELHPSDLADPLLLEESRRALDELTDLLSLGSIYPFQQ